MTILEGKVDHSQEERNLVALQRYGDYFPWYDQKSGNANLSTIQQVVNAYNRSAFSVQATITEVVDSSKSAHILTVVARKPKQETEFSVADKPMVLIRMPLSSDRVSDREYRYVEGATRIFGDGEKSLGSALIKEVTPLRINPDGPQHIKSSPARDESRNLEPVVPQGDEGDTNFGRDSYIDDTQMRRALQKSYAQIGIDMRENLEGIELKRIAEIRLIEAGYDLSGFSKDPEVRMKQVSRLIEQAKEDLITLERKDVILKGLHREQEEQEVVLDVLRTMQDAERHFLIRLVAPPEARQALKLVIEAASARTLQAMFPGKSSDEIATILAKNSETQANILKIQAKGIADAAIEKARGNVADRKAQIQTSIEEQRQNNELQQEQRDNFWEFLQERIHDLSYGVRDFFIDPRSGAVVKTADMAGVLLSKAWNAVRTPEGVGFGVGGLVGSLAGVGMEYGLVSALPKLTFFSGAGGNWVIGSVTFIGGLIGSYIAYRRASGANKHSPEQSTSGQGSSYGRPDINRPSRPPIAPGGSSPFRPAPKPPDRFGGQGGTPIN